MIILTTSANQTFPIIPISQTDLIGSEIYMEFTNETTKESFIYDPNIEYTNKDLLYIGADDLTFLKENTFYVLRVYFSVTGITIYKDRVFCTNQPKSSYSINNGEYTLPNIDNNFYKI